MQRRAHSWISQGFETLVSKINSNPSSADEHHYDIVIVGSGYGGAIAASQLAGLQQTIADLQTKTPTARPLKICVLERGNEYLAGMFPSRLADLPQHVRFSSPNSATPAGNRDGLFDIRIGPHLNTILANGLGGGSLINAGVMIEPRPEIFDSRWPTPLRSGTDQPLFTQYYEEAKQLLGASDQQGLNTIARHKTHQQTPLTKHQQLMRLTKGQRNSDSGDDARPNIIVSDAAITVAMEDKINSGGVQLNACNLCGDCATGCNHNAKDSLDTNLLVQAWKKGVELYTGATVLKLEPLETRASSQASASPTGWTLLIAHTKNKMRQQQGKPLKLTASKVILAAGSFGSTEILLRSQSNRFPVSMQLGQHFSSNGDMLATVFNQNNTVNAIADETTQPGERHIGPTITGILDLRDNPQPLLIQEMAVPGALRRIYEEVVTTTDGLAEIMHPDMSRHEDGQPGADSTNGNDPYNVDPHKIQRTAIYAIMGDDGSQGSLELVTSNNEAVSGDDVTVNARDMDGDGGISVRWSGLPDHPLFVQQIETLEALVEHSDIGGRAQGNPAWRPLPESMAHLLGAGKGPQLTVHPLGGCRMGDTVNDGVVDQYGRVFNPANLSQNKARSKDQSRDQSSGQNEAVYDNLVVLDGAMIPCALGANPALTISAVSLRAVRELRQRWGFTEVSSETKTTEPEKQTQTARPAFADKSVVAPTKATKIEITERISGRVTLTDARNKPLDCMVDITLRFQPKPVLDFVHRTERTLTVDNTALPDEPISQLRIFERKQWQALIQKGVSDDVFTEHALFVAPVKGTMEIMGRQASTGGQRIRRTLLPWLLNRGMRDAYQALEEWLDNLFPFSKVKPSGSNKNEPGRLARISKTVKNKYIEIKALASHGGEVRLFDYQLNIDRPATGWPDTLGGFNPDAATASIMGCKYISYTRAANPMRQFEDMFIHTFPGLQRKSRQPKKRTPYLRFDSRFLSHHNKPLIRIVEQQDQVTALADIGSFFAYFSRLLIGIHLWSFRKPDTQLPGAPNRLPGAIKGIATPEIIELTVGTFNMGLAIDLPVNVRLTRYPQEHSSEPPLVMIHGYSASGTTYTHPSIDPNLARYFWKKGRDVWVLDLRTSSGMPTAMLPWSFEDVAFADIPVAIDHICQKTQREKVDILAHCMGSAMFSMAVLAPPENNALYFRERQLLPQRIRKSVLSQVGPRVVFSPENIFRAYSLSYIQQLMPFVFYSFKRSDAPGAVEQLLDRLLSALPYPDGEFELENPLTPWKKTPFVGTRHRMDGLYGRTFSLANLSKKTLDSIDDIFGPLSMVTLSQVIQFAIHERVTNKHGENEFVTHERLKQFWTFPTLSIHGDENGLADISTLGRMQETMQAAGCDYHTEVLHGYGHQDALIGKGVRKNFDKIHQFFQQPDQAPQPVKTPSTKTHSYNLQLPYSGPVIGGIQTDETTRLPVSLGFSSQMIKPEFVLFVAVNRHKQHLRLASAHHDSAQAAQLPDSAKDVSLDYRLLRENLCVKFATPTQDRWLKTELPLTPNFEQADGILTLVLDDLDVNLSGLLYDEVLPGNLLDLIELPSIASGTPQETLSAYLQEHLLSAGFAKALMQKLQQPLAELENAIIELPQVRDDSITRFAIGACQYAPGMLDLRMAYRSYQRLANRLDAKENPKPQFLVLAGDQVYTDASAGLFDPTDRYDRFTANYHKWLHRRSVKSVLRRLPSFMMLDDHELKNDWDMTEYQRDNHEGNHYGGNNKALFQNGKRAYLNFQRNLHQAPAELHQLPVDTDLEKTPLWYPFKEQGLDFFMLDSRTERQGRAIKTEASCDHIDDAKNAQLISDAQLEKLKQWLKKVPADDKPRFIVSPSMLLPRRMVSTQSTHGSIHSDAWDGYPRTQHDLLNFIAENDIRNLVFLSGDEHLSSTVEIDLTHADNNTRTRVYSIHSSGLYSPFTFVNSTPELFAGHETFDIQGAGNIQCEVNTQYYPGDGFALLTVSPATESKPWMLECEFDREATESMDTTQAGKLQQRWALESSPLKVRTP